MATTSSQSAIAAIELRKSFGDHIVLDGIDLRDYALDKARFPLYNGSIRNFGASGSGKHNDNRRDTPHSQHYRQTVLR